MIYLAEESFLHFLLKRCPAIMVTVILDGIRALCQIQHIYYFDIGSRVACLDNDQESYFCSLISPV